MKVLKVEPMKKPEVVMLDSGLESLQEAVGGYIEVVYPYEDSVGILCNEAGKITGLTPNRGLYVDDLEMFREIFDRELYDILCGTFYVMGLSEDDFCSLTDEQIEKYSDRFLTPQVLHSTGNKVIMLEG